MHTIIQQNGDLSPLKKNGISLIAYLWNLEGLAFTSLNHQWLEMA